MNIIIVGNGKVGYTLAQCLSKDGHDITVLDRGEFKVGWSPRLQHPVWVAYHVPAERRFPDGTRPNFTKDRSAAASPAAGDYSKTGYDRGHMAPNHAIVARFGEEAQKHIKTFEEDPDLEIRNGRFGPYLPYEENNYKLTKEMTQRAQELTLQECMEYIEKEAHRGQRRSRK